MGEGPCLGSVAERTPVVVMDLADPERRRWTELSALSRAEVSQATGMLVAQLDVGQAVALVRLRAHAYATGAPVTAVARDILDHRLFLEAH